MQVDRQQDKLTILSIFDSFVENLTEIDHSLEIGVEFEHIYDIKT